MQKPEGPLRVTLQTSIFSCGLALAICAALSGCNDTRDFAPPSPDKPWSMDAQGRQKTDTSGARDPSHPADGNDLVFALKPDSALPWKQTRVMPRDVHAYTLPELIDLAERNNKDTRIAWEAARQQAIDIGIAQAAWMPTLTASVLSGYRRTATALPNYLSSRGYLTSDAFGAFPELSFSYLLFDFGATRSAVAVARQESIAANIEFTQAHQQLMLDVTRAYYTYDAAHALLAASKMTLENEQLLQTAAESRQQHGQATVVDVAIARRNTAQARYELDHAVATEHTARYTLLAAMGLPAEMTLTVASSSDRPLPPASSQDSDVILRDALRHRPDILADLARLRAADAGVQGAKASLLPKVMLSGDVQGNIARMKTRGTFQHAPTESIAQPQAGAYLEIDWPLYEGGKRENSIRLAESRAAQARDVLEKQTDTAEREVATAQDALQTSLSEVQSATALKKSAQTAFDAARESYAHGEGTLTDASSAAAALEQAQAALAQDHAQALTNAAALAFALGDLTSVAD